MSDFADEAQALEAREWDVIVFRLLTQHASPPNRSGRCSDCGDPIDPDRLQALPGACRCLECASARERHGRQFSGVFCG